MGLFRIPSIRARGCASAVPLGAACATTSANCFDGDDLPDSNNVDSNCDGIDGNVNAAIFVATSGSDLNPGTMAKPLLTLTAALAAAQKDSSKTQILMGTGDYQEPATVNLVDGVGFSAATIRSRSGRDASTSPTTIHGKATTALFARGFKQSTNFGRVTIAAADGAQPSESSFALVAIDVAAMTFDDTCILQAGKGAPGAQGTVGTDGAGGGGGTAGTNGNVDDQSSPGTGGPPGQNQACPDANGGPGGKGGSDPSFAGGKGTDSPAGVAGGAGGSTTSCTPQDWNARPGSERERRRGRQRRATGGKSAGTFDPQTYVYVSADGADGADGQDGAGGGGGGGSSGQTGFSCVDGAGNGGGGGGAGGCGAYTLHGRQRRRRIDRDRFDPKPDQPHASSAHPTSERRREAAKAARVEAAGTPGTGGGTNGNGCGQNRHERQRRRRTQRRPRRRGRWWRRRTELRNIRHGRVADNRQRRLHARSRWNRRHVERRERRGPTGRVETDWPLITTAASLRRASDDDVDAVARVGFDRLTRLSVKLDVRLVREKIPTVLVLRIARDERGAL